MKRQQFQDHLANKAWADPAFKERLLKNPRAVFSEELSKISEGVAIPDHVQIEVLEEKPNRIYLVVPINPADVTGKVMTEADLQQVAGGETLDIVSVTATQVQTQVTTSVQLDVVQAVQVAVA